MERPRAVSDSPLGPRSSRGGARARILWALVAAAAPSSAVAQVPPDTVGARPDSLPPDSAVAVDSLAVDSLAADSLAVDSLAPPPVLPRSPDPVPPGVETGVREWDRDELLALRGQTLLDLLADVPGMLAIRGGDYGSAVAAFPVGYAGGGLRLYWDGVEHLPLEGAVADLSRIPLSGLESVRVVMRPTGAEVRLARRVHADARAFSQVDAGTGDPSANVLRGTFSMPRVLGGKAAVALERLDGQGRDGSGSSTAAWLRYSLHAGDRAGVRLETRRVAVERVAEVGVPESVQRVDWTLQGRWAPRADVLVDGWGTRASAQPGDTLSPFPFAMESRSQWGAQVSVRRGRLWTRAGARFNGGSGIADRELSAEATFASPRWGGLTGRARRETWGDRVGVGRDLSAWFTPVSHVSLFAERGGGLRSVPFLAPPPSDSTDSVAPPMSRFTDRSGGRWGARLAWRGARLSGARLVVEADSVWPTRLHFDRGGLTLPQARRRGWELTAALPLWPRGLFVAGETQLWDASDSIALYFPDHLYRAGLSFRNAYRESGSFQLWVDLGVLGRSEMRVPQPDAEATPREGDDGQPPPSTVPFHQSWYFRLQMRILSLNVFATVENLTLRDNNQDAPGRLLLRTRSLYGVRWTFWN